MRTTLFLTAALVALLPQPGAGAEEPDVTWLSVPRSELKIIIGKDGGRVTGPGWEHRFERAARNLDFEIAPGRRFVLHRSGNTWHGQYFHPRIRSGLHRREEHKMTFTCGSGSCADLR
jgi:hypothetical protein